MKFLPLPSQASLDKVAPLDHWGPLPHEIAVDASPHPAAAALQSGSRPPDAHPFSFPQNRSHANNHPGNELEVQDQLSIQIPPHTSAAPATHPGLFRNESDAMSTDDGGFSGGFSGGFPGVSGIPAAKPLFSPPVTGVAQAPVFSWTHQEYCASGMLREMTCVEARVSSPLQSFCAVRWLEQRETVLPTSCQHASSTAAACIEYCTTSLKNTDPS